MRSVTEAAQLQKCLDDLEAVVSAPDLDATLRRLGGVRLQCRFSSIQGAHAGGKVLFGGAASGEGPSGPGDGVDAGAISPTSAPALTPKVVSVGGWRTVFVCVCVGGVVLMVACWGICPAASGCQWTSRHHCSMHWAVVQL